MEPLPNVELSLVGETLGWTSPVPVAPADAEGKFEIDLTQVPGFQMPHAKQERTTVKLLADGAPVGEVALGPWAMKWANKVSSCTSQSACRAVREEAEGLSGGMENVIAAARRREQSYKFKGALGVSANFKKVGENDVWYESDPYIKFSGNRAQLKQDRLGRQKASGVLYSVKINNRTDQWVMADLEINAYLMDCKHLGERGSIVGALTNTCTKDDERHITFPIFMSPNGQQTFAGGFEMTGVSIDLATFLKGNVVARGTAKVRDAGPLAEEMHSILVDLHTTGEGVSRANMEEARERAQNLDHPDAALLKRRLDDLAGYYENVGLLK